MIPASGLFTDCAVTITYKVILYFASVPKPKPDSNSILWLHDDAHIFLLRQDNKNIPQPNQYIDLRG